MSQSPTPQLRVLAGNPTAEEIAAVVIALAGGDHTPAEPPAGTWLRAARQEGIGGPAVGSRADLGNR